MHHFMKISHSLRRHPRVWVAIIVMAALIGVPAAWSAAPKPGIDAPGRADIIVIDGLKALGPLERPPVLFYHDQHTAALAKQNKDCLACHPSDKDVLSPKFERIADGDRQSLMDLYHDRCLACHTALRDQQMAAGPVVCGECHVADRPIRSSRKAMGLDRSLHYRHVRANENQCERCHHEYNAETKKLFYAKGQEGACLYCHKQASEENRISNRLASHRACIGCHRARTAEKKDTGPLECGGCHDPKQQAIISQVTDIPRMERHQPDVTLVKIHGPQRPADAPQTRTTVVAFDHQTHERHTGQCRACHHAAIAPCANCHTIEGHADGKMVKLAQAMHQPDASMSCVGCHSQRQLQPECAGCHAAIPAARTWSTQTACKACHVTPREPVADPLADEPAKTLAAALVAARRPLPTLPAIEEIPETVAIGHLKDQYEAVNMPHRRIVKKLAEGVRDDRLATAFHGAPTTLCQGCHHNSPAGLKPPQCGVCHGRSSDALNLTRPGLMAAYHQQCLECHERMGIAKPASRECTACHAKRAS
ncbi:MAG: cytochrome c3 family protein [Desulfatitalea sp.]